MKKYWSWFLLSGTWILATILDLVEKRSVIKIGYSIFAAILFAFLGVVQCFCDKKAEKGKKIFHKICIGAAVISVLLYLIVVVGISSN